MFYSKTLDFEFDISNPTSPQNFHKNQYNELRNFELKAAFILTRMKNLIFILRYKMEKATRK